MAELLVALNTWDPNLFIFFEKKKYYFFLIDQPIVYIDQSGILMTTRMETVSVRVKVFFANGIIADTSVGNTNTLRNNTFLSVYPQQ